MIMTRWADMRGDERALFVMMAAASCLSLLIFAGVLCACGAFHWLVPAGSGEVVSVEVSGEEVGENEEDFQEEDFKDELDEVLDEVALEVGNSGEWGIVFEQYEVWLYEVGAPDDCWRYLLEYGDMFDGDEVYIVAPSGAVSVHTVAGAVDWFESMGR